jgi:NADH-quinone oxidoreductase subunit F
MACGMCRKQCPADAIDGDKKIIHIIDQALCTNCGTCFEVCPAKFGAVTKLSGVPVPAPLAQEKRVIIKKASKKSPKEAPTDNQGKAGKNE